MPPSGIRQAVTFFEKTLKKVAISPNPLWQALGEKMGVELHITRAEFWAENEDSSISCEEWVQLIERDPDLQLDTKNGEYHAVWSGDKKHDDHWLEWFQGNISTKWPRRALYEKMLEIASTLEAKVQDDDGSVYPEEAGWSNPYEEGEKKQEVVEPEIEVHKEPTSKSTKKKWWQFW